MANPFVARKGIDILADIMQYMEPTACRNLLKNLQAQGPNIVVELKRRLFLFEDLAWGDQRGLQKLIKLTTLRDLALSLKGAPDTMLQALAKNMSQRLIEDLREEITRLGPTPGKEVEEARIRVMTTARTLINQSELFIDKDGRSRAPAGRSGIVY